MENRAWIEISTSNLAKNVKNYLKILPKETALMAVVKANAYGHGLPVVIPTLVQSGVTDFGVFEMNDAALIKEKYSDVNVLVLNQVYLNEVETAFKYGIDITVSSLETMKQIAKIENIKDLLINIKIDTGLSRQGIKTEELDELLNIITKNQDINIVSIYTHLVGAESHKFDKITKKQLQLLEICQEKFNERGYYPLVHTSATSGFVMNPNTAFDVVRGGIGIYGLWPSSEVEKESNNSLKLNPVLSFKTKIIQVKKIKKGDVVGYDATFVAKKDMTVASVPVGYYDGLPRSLSNKGHMLVGGQKCNILGRIMMNMCVIDVSSVKSVKMGDEVVIIGKQKNAVITAEELASIAGTINYEIVTRLNPRIMRIAIK